MFISNRYIKLQCDKTYLYVTFILVTPITLIATDSFLSGVSMFWRDIGIGTMCILSHSPSNKEGRLSSLVPNYELSIQLHSYLFSQM